ncbi:creatinine amidohydrolase [Mariprofundus ferrinatatus]|uniref:Creatinine amidohydrolase n=1 Tax=Mariprofundus ferrinatatus TaxID=1921087 RepID=A0A2K8L596_9PROT|nr:creatininase family protein [Mariprofundus ferrinatatus]ATX82480.1 creatinine amidohydrolase [Mariprofundus ferrinatatus]
MLLALSTWQEIEAYLERSTAIIIPIGSTEQHGPNGLIGTDSICPTHIAAGMAEKEDMLVAPTISYGMSQHHMAFAGSATLSPSTLMAVVIDIVGSFRQHGFTHFYFLNGHGGNIAPVTSAFSEIYAGHGNDKTSPRCRLANWWRDSAIAALAKELYGNAEGYHATVSEVALSYHAHPEAVKHAEMEPAVAPTDEFYDAADFRRKFPDGRIGSSPQLATVADGERFYQLAVETLTKDFHAFVANS